MRTRSTLLALALAVTFPAAAQEKAPAKAAADAKPAVTKSGKAAATTADKKKDAYSAETFAGLELRDIGPAVTSGRIGDLAVDPVRKGTYYVAVASGGVWKTTNWGTTFEPVFDAEGSFSIGCVTLDPTNPLVVWVGTRREQQPAERRLRRRRLPLSRRREDLGERRAESLGAHREDPRPPEGRQDRLRRRAGAALGRRRRPRPLQDDGRREDVEGRPDDLRQDGRQRRLDGPARPRGPLRGGLPAAPARLHADQRRPRERHPQVDRRRRDLDEADERPPEGGRGPDRPRRSRRRRPTRSTPSSRRAARTAASTARSTAG